MSSRARSDRARAAAEEATCPAMLPHRTAQSGTADPVRAVSVISTGSVEIHPEHAHGSQQAAVLVAADLARDGCRHGRSTSTSSNTPRGCCCSTPDRTAPRSPTTRTSPAGSPESSTTGWPGSTSARTRRSTASSARSGIRRATSTPRSSPTCTRTTSAGSRSWPARNCSSARRGMGAAVRVLPRAARLPPRAHRRSPARGGSRISFEPTSDAALAPFTEVARRHGRRLARPAPHIRATPPAPCRCSSGDAGLPPLLLVGDLTYDAELLRTAPASRRRRPRPARQDHRKVLALAQRMPGLVILPAHDPTAAQRLLDSAR